jgi:exodeoxyribonuclease VII large subunit
MDCLSVQELNELAREALNSCFGSEVWVAGEIHGLKAHAKSGHLYFDLVDKDPGPNDQYTAKVSCAFFRGSFLAWKRKLAALGFDRFELANGIELKVRARVDLYTREGRFQLLVSDIDPAYTFGAIAKRRAQTIERLKANGLLEKNKGLDLPVPILNIGLITSRGSAAYKDFTSILLGSPYAFRITLFDAHMQGDNTVREITRGIRALEQEPDVDIIVIVRGGGARTDLFAFDDLDICTSVALCTLPVMTGIGHEIDLSVADMTAHTCFVTPTDVARYLVKEADSLWNFLEDASGEIADASRSLLDRSSRKLGMLATRLAYLTQKHTADAHAVLRNASTLLYRISSGQIAIREKELLSIRSGLTLHAHSGIQALKALLDRFERELMIMRPEETLRRGYSITLDEKGKAVTDADAIPVDAKVETRLLKGKIFSIVERKEP